MGGTFSIFSRTPDVTHTPFFSTKPFADQTIDALIVWLVSAKGIPREDLAAGASDPRVTITAIGAGMGTSELGLDTSSFRVLSNATDVPDWNRKRAVAFVRGSANKFALTVADDDTVGTDKELLRFEAELPGSSYEEYRVPFRSGRGQLVFKARLVPAGNRIISKPAMDAFPLALEVFTGLSEDNAAVLAFHRRPGNKKALLWLPGRADYFYHPHVGKALEAAGVDVYVLNYRRCGLCRKLKLFENPYLVRAPPRGLRIVSLPQTSNATAARACGRTPSARARVLLRPAHPPPPHPAPPPPPLLPGWAAVGRSGDAHGDGAVRRVSGGDHPVSRVHPGAGPVRGGARVRLLDRRRHPRRLPAAAGRCALRRIRVRLAFF
jgi:hypothetical protein